MSTGSYLCLESLPSELSHPHSLNPSQFSFKLGQLPVFASQPGTMMGGNGSAFASAPRAGSAHRI
eukprot:2351109-Rhodomonas_salina.2